MGVFKKVKKAVKKVAKVAAPIAAAYYAPGLSAAMGGGMLGGAGAGALIGSGTSLLNGGNLKQTVGAAVLPLETSRCINSTQSISIERVIVCCVISARHRGHSGVIKSAWRVLEAA